jgi:hypothetical protein
MGGALSVELGRIQQARHGRSFRGRVAGRCAPAPASVPHHPPTTTLKIPPRPIDSPTARVNAKPAHLTRIGPRFPCRRARGRISDIERWRRWQARCGCRVAQKGRCRPVGSVLATSRPAA